MIRNLYLRLNQNAGLLLALTTFSWAGNVVAARLAVGEISPMAIICLRWAIVSAAFAIVYHRQLAGELPALWPYRWRLFWLGSLGITIPNAFIFEAARFTTGLNLAIIQGVQPVLILVGAWLIFRSRIGLLRGAGAAVTIAGVVLIGAQGDLASLTFNSGDLLAFLGCIAGTGYALGLRNRPPISSLALFVGVAIGAFLSSLPLLWIESRFDQTIWPGPRGLLVLLYVAIFTSVVGHVTDMRAVSLIGAGRVSLILNLIPVFGAFFSVILLGETFALYHATALALVLIGIWVSERLGAR